MKFINSLIKFFVNSLFLIVILPLIIYGQNAEFKADFDYATFHSGAESGKLELYYSFYQPGMKISIDDSKAVVKGRLDVEIKNKVSGELFVDNNWSFASEYGGDISNQNLIGLLNFTLPVGEYICTLSARDLIDTLRQSSAIFNMVIPVVDSLNFSLSDIEAAGKIVQFSEDTESPFYKNTLEVIPNPGLVYGEGIPVLYFYTELYNINNDNVPEHLMVEHYLFNSRNESVYRKTKYVSRNNSSVVEIGAVKINTFPSGTYNLVVAVSDSLKNITRTSLKKIFIYNPAIVDTAAQNLSQLDLLATELAVLTEDELDEAFNSARYLASYNEVEKWNKLTNLDGKRTLLYDFWKNRDPDPETPENELKIEYYKRVDFANKNFKNLMQKKGWKADQGRVYILYGSPSEIERFPNEQETKPYEVWRYNELEGGVQFVFVDYSGYNEYRLIHSDKRGELSDTNWRDRITE